METKEKNLFRGMQVLFIILPFFYGMYYEFCGTVITVLILGILILLFLKKRHLRLSLSVGFFMSILFAACYFITIPYAVDSGIAALGAAKVIWIPLFLIACHQLPSEKRNKIFSMIPYMGVLLCLLGFMAYFLPWLQGYFYINGRLSSGFQYANTFALFLLAGIILLCDKKEMVWKDYLSGGILLCGIALSGSRIVFVLTFLTLLYLIIRNKNLRLAAGISFLAAIFLLYIFFQKDVRNIGRITTISFTDSTLLGRFLYAGDALGLLLKHPFGMGHMGYYYMENEIQTGMYSVQYVHNDLLQIGLDLGLIPMLLYVAAVVYCLAGKQIPHDKKLILLVVFLHGLLDFDLAYSVILCMVFMVMDDRMIMWKDWKISRTIHIRGKQWLAVSGVLLFGALYLSVPLIARYQEKMDLAIQWYPWDTEAKLALLSESEDARRVDRLADEILQQNDTCALAYYAKAMVANCNNQYKKMIWYQKESIARNYFSHEAYLNYAYMLYDGLYYAAETGNEQVYAMCKKEMEKLPSYMESAKKKLGKLGKMIHDQPDLEVDEEMQEIMKILK